MKRISLILLLMLLTITPLVYGAAGSETGDTRTVPVTLYGKEVDGTVTAMLVDSDGKLETSGGGGGGAWTATNDGAYLDGDATMSGAFEAATVNTGQGANELYAMNQDVESTDAVTFATVDTGEGANDLFDMDQNVLEASDVTFNSVLASGDLTVDSGTLYVDSDKDKVTIGSVFVADDDNGLVGINTSSPSAELDVTGDAIISGELSVSSIKTNSVEGNGGGSNQVTITGDLICNNDADITGSLTSDGILLTKDVALATVLSTSEISVNAKPIIYENNNGVTMYIHEIRGWAKGYDDTVVTIKEADADGASNIATVEAITCTNGSDPYTVTVAKGDIDANTIEDGHVVYLEFDTTDDPSSATVRLLLESTN